MEENGAVSQGRIKKLHVGGKAFEQARISCIKNGKTLDDSSVHPESIGGFKMAKRNVNFRMIEIKYS